MEVLEIKPLKNKKISVYMVKKAKWDVKIEEITKLIEYLKISEIQFAAIDLEEENLNKFKKSVLIKLLKKYKIPYYLVDIPEYVKSYIFEEIIEKKDQVDELITEWNSLEDKHSFKGLNIRSWIDLLESEVKEKTEFINLKVKPQWITKKILDILRTYKGEEMSFVLLAQENIFFIMIMLLKELGMEVIIYEGNKNYLSFNIITNQEEIKQW